ncbi:MAG: hypothetical protein CSA36_03915, partial [Draconibacterium sp.]
YAQKKATKIVCFKSNMDCSQCENTLTEHLKFLRGVKDLNVNHVANTIYIEYKEGKNSEEKFAKAIEKKGYKAEKVTIEEYRQIIQKAAEKGHEHGAEVHTVRKKQQVQK